MAGIDFTVVCANADESVGQNVPPQEAVKEIAGRKAKSVFQLQKDENCVIIAADTIVAFENKIFGKPCSRQQAFLMLSALSGKKHQVYTGVCVIDSDGKETEFVEKTDVEFYPLSDEEIESYISTGEPMDKAGAYGIQGKGALLVRKINGDFYNVVGLPISHLIRILNHIL